MHVFSFLPNPTPHSTPSFLFSFSSPHTSSNLMYCGNKTTASQAGIAQKICPELLIMQMFCSHLWASIQITRSANDKWVLTNIMYKWDICFLVRWVYYLVLVIYYILQEGIATINLWVWITNTKTYMTFTPFLTQYCKLKEHCLSQMLIAENIRNVQVQKPSGRFTKIRKKMNYFLAFTRVISPFQILWYIKSIFKGAKAYKLLQIILTYSGYWKLINCTIYSHRTAIIPHMHTCF